MVININDVTMKWGQVDALFFRYAKRFKARPREDHASYVSRSGESFLSATKDRSYWLCARIFESNEDHSRVRRRSE